jgi:hypothetical protein
VRVTRATLGAFGAGISLVVAASAALLVISSVVAFKGWPDDLGSGAPAVATRLAASETPPSAAASARSRSVPASALPAPAPSTNRQVPGSARVAPAPTHVTSSTTPGTGDTPTTPKGSAPIGGSSNGVPVPRVGSAVTGATHQTAGTVSQTSQAAAGAVAPASPPLAGALTQIGAAGSAAVAGTGQAVGGIINKLLP